MTDKQIEQLLINRATKAGQENHLGLAKLVVFRSYSKLFLAIKYANVDEPFWVRFSRGAVRGLFKLTSDNPEFIAWEDQVFKQVKPNGTMKFDIDTAPKSVKHLIAHTVIQALKTKGMGLDCCAVLSSYRDLVLVDTNESYEEVAIETDLESIFDFQEPEITL